ncbi:urea ABC transporter ATP-binding protein UrtD [Spirulina sp. CCNP1310]|uniref:urea ABC transporter ATP-binding protein UrtD n=1 Tax=Spirulina sp. CCNP1310 TaxID=3110249 RepID=UPI002B21103C|nr:urea ABC transporter ATP-binding protein UrtD [Spirulina sp. CCNP1310]MEA5419416.1 urea ABC transporter ATP-binding protein UrtD [Spirulina sp. CCNP1310]
MAAPILEIENLTVSFDGFKALNNLTFAMQPGELRVIIGPNGAGKTTFLDIITGKVQPTSGTVRFKGKDLRKIPEHQISRLGIGRKFQTPRVYLNLTVRENLDLATNRRKNVLATLLRKPTGGDRQTIIRLLETISLSSKADFPANLLSHGEKQRLEIGMLVAQSPDLLLVDEPVAGLTDEETERVGDLLISLAQSHSIIVIEHDMEFVRQIARQVTVLHQGSVLCEGTMDEIQDDPRVIEVYLGQAPTVTPDQMRILRIAAAMAWADGNFAPEQMRVILNRLSQQFSNDPAHQAELREELKNYLGKEISLETLVPQITTEEERETVLRLSYEIIRSNRINEAGTVVYQKLLEFLNLPPAMVQTIEAEIEAQYAEVAPVQDMASSQDTPPVETEDLPPSETR